MTFSLDRHLGDIYARYPEADHKPLIGITTNHDGLDATLRDRYYKQVVAAGGVPLLVPPVADASVIVNTLDSIDALLLTGGGDHNPLWSGEEPRAGLHAINKERDLPELLATRLAFNRQLPMLGICRGLQTMAVALGGRVHQDLGSADGLARPLVKHSQDADRDEPTHTVAIERQTMLHDIYAADHACVNSFHHQAVADTGPHFRVAARAADGVVEAMESSEHKWMMGVQWHPEWLGQDGLPLFRWLVEGARLFSHAKRLHRDTLTLDTHCDTPMLFPEGVDFWRRDPRTLYDAHKMDDGRIDAVTMVAYLPQDMQGSPRQYADDIFDRIESMAGEHPDRLALAGTPDQMMANKQAGRKSIVLGIENGLALEHDLDNIDHFRRRGVTYITLCHNGDNDICDSARRSQRTHGGVSPFGEQAIRRMNERGVMVDLSHAAESSFYDALDISSTPIVCSHSNCRALCDHERNLTDDQLRSLAARGGLAHVTLYHGFLRTDGQATLLDAIAHLEHAIAVMGVEHVGLGTDFDGDGTVSGCADASELINFTMHLLRRRHSDHDIALIWGGNWLRLMRQVQAHHTTT